MASIGLSRVYTKRELLDDMVDEINGIGLVVAIVYLHCSYACCIIHIRILIPFAGSFL